MQRLGEFDNKVIIEQHNEPENKHVIWKDPDENKYKEYVDGSWVESDKIATPGGGGGGGDFPYEYAVFNGTITINPDDWDTTEDVPRLDMPICDANFESEAISMLAGDGADIKFDDVSGSQEGGIDAYCYFLIDDDQDVTLLFEPSLEDNKIHMTCVLDSYITEQINTVTFNNVIFINKNAY